MSPERATALFARIGVPPLQGSSDGVRAKPRPCSLGYELKVSPSGLLVERWTQIRRAVDNSITHKQNSQPELPKPADRHTKPADQHTKPAD